MAEKYIAMGFPDGDVKAFPSEEYHEKCKAKHPDVAGWVWGTVIDEALSPCHAAFQARLKSIAGGDAIAIAADMLEYYLGEEDWEVDNDAAEKVKTLHAFIKEADEESPLDGLVEWTDGDSVIWQEKDEPAPDDEWERVEEAADNPDQLSLI